MVRKRTRTKKKISECNVVPIIDEEVDTSLDENITYSKFDELFYSLSEEHRYIINRVIVGIFVLGFSSSCIISLIILLCYIAFGG